MHVKTKYDKQKYTWLYSDHYFVTKDQNVDSKIIKPESNTALKQSKTLYYVTPSEYTNFTGISCSPALKGH